MNAKQSERERLEKRSRELLTKVWQGNLMERRILGTEDARSVEACVVAAMLQLAQETADARADEIARALESEIFKFPGNTVRACALSDAAKIARRALELKP